MYATLTYFYVHFKEWVDYAKIILQTAHYYIGIIVGK